MIIHVVKPEETIESIAEKYNVTVSYLIKQNAIKNPKDLVVGQTIVVVPPQITYTVQRGDTLRGIAFRFGIGIMELIRNNPYIMDSGLIVGDILVISYDTKKEYITSTIGYAYPFIDKRILRKTLPFLTYLTIFNYRVTKDGDIIDIDDLEIIQIAKNYGVAPMMLISTLSEKGVGSRETAYSIINNEEVQDRLIQNVLTILNNKGYYGVNIYLQYIQPENREKVEAYIQKFTERLHKEGFRIVVTLTPSANIERTVISYNLIDYSVLGNTVDALLFLSYEWGYSYGPPASVTPVNILSDILSNVLNHVPNDKILLGLPIIGYDWHLPYISGVSTANAINYDTAIELAIAQNVEIQYDENTEAPYYFYNFNKKEIHLVWFKDARSIEEIVSIVPKYGLQGLSIWNIMYFFTQMWLVINSQYEIEKVL